MQGGSQTGTRQNKLWQRHKKKDREHGVVEG